MQEKNLQTIFQAQKAFFYSDATKSYGFRIKQLKKFKKVIKENGKSLCDSVYQDFQKPVEETYISEIAMIIRELNHSINNLKKWMRKKKVATNLTNFLGKSYLFPHPLGKNLIIGAWNFPYSTVFTPLIACIAAGNTAIIKPSEIAPHSSNAIKGLIKDNFSREYITVIEGGVEVSSSLLALPFDHVFFTGSTQVGKIVMEACAKHLSRVTLELGGKSPAIVDKDADIKKAAKKIVFGKGSNSGQNCIAPDYVYAHEKIQDSLLEALKDAYHQLYPSEKHIASIVNEKNFQRLNTILNQEKIYFQLPHKREDKFIPPTIIYPANWEKPAMKEEIFGPILPVLTFSRIDEVIKTINQREIPLALYYFGKMNWPSIEKGIQFGGGTVNDTLLHFANPNLPFGGVGSSGTGCYHGYSGFKTFSHFKSIFRKGKWPDFSFRYPPHDGKKMKWIRKLF